jgi:hypothetical protein
VRLFYQEMDTMSKQPARKQKLGPNQLKWLKALESGKYKQGRWMLQHAVTKECCCLGVGCLVLGPKPSGVSGEGSHKFDGTPLHSVTPVDSICQRVISFYGA